MCDEELLMYQPSAGARPVSELEAEYSKYFPGEETVYDMATGVKHESEIDFKQRLTEWFQQMMYVSGETAEASPETTYLIEEIVREQVVEMVSSARVIRTNLTCSAERSNNISQQKRIEIDINS